MIGLYCSQRDDSDVSSWFVCAAGRIVHLLELNHASGGGIVNLL